MARPYTASNRYLIKPPNRFFIICGTPNRKGVHKGLVRLQSVGVQIFALLYSLYAILSGQLAELDAVGWLGTIIISFCVTFGINTMWAYNGASD